jgi:hypothetical protein
MPNARHFNIHEPSGYRVSFVVFVESFVVLFHSTRPGKLEIPVCLDMTTALYLSDALRIIQETKPGIFSRKGRLRKPLHQLIAVLGAFWIARVLFYRTYICAVKHIHTLFCRTCMCRYFRYVQHHVVPSRGR